MRALGLAAIVVLAGCVPPVQVDYVQPASRPQPPSIRLVEDRFSPVQLYVVDPPIGSSAGPLGARVVTQLIASVPRAGGPTTFAARVGVEHASRSWAQFSRANDASGRSLDVVRGSADVSCRSAVPGCLYAESVIVSLPADALRRAAGQSTPLEFKLYGSAFDAEIAIPANHIAVLLEQFPGPSRRGRLAT